MFEIYDRAVEAYLTNIRINGLSVKTQANYAKALRYFREAMEQDGFDDVSPAAVLAFKNRKSGSCGLTTIYQYVGVVKRFSEFCENYEFCDSFVRVGAMPDAKIAARAARKPYEHILSLEHIHTLIHAERPQNAHKPHTWAREQAEVALLLLSGARNTELRSLTPADLDWENGVMHLRVTKGGKPRMVPFTKTAQEKVRAYLNSGLRPETASDNEPLFGTVGRKSGEWHELADTQLSDLIYQYTKSVLGEEYACRTHAQRHGFASAALELGYTIDQIGDILGHANPDTTKIYAQRLKPEKLCFDVGTALDNAFA